MSSSPAIANSPSSSACQIGDRPTGDGRLGRRRPAGCRAQAQQADGAAADPVIVVEFDGGDRAGDREVAVAAGELLDREAAPSRPHRESHSEQDLVGRQRGLPHPGEEFAGRDAAPPGGRERLDLRVEGQRDGRVLGGGVGVGDRAADRAAVADLEVTDQRGGPGQQRDRGADLRRRRRRRRAVVPPPMQSESPSRSMPLQLVDPGDVDEVVEERQAQGEHRHQTLTTGEELRVVAELGEQLGGLGRTCRAGGSRTAPASQEPAAHGHAEHVLSIGHGVTAITAGSWPWTRRANV